MPAGNVQEDSVDALAPEDELRAHVYRLLAQFLGNAPSQDVLDAGASIEGDDTDFGRAIATFAHLCARTDADAASEEYHDLFIGVARGELVPFGSYYLTGFLHEKPLAKLRNDMAELGITRAPSASEPEDHVAALMDIMAGLITGAFGKPASAAEQRKFFDTHIGPWAQHFFSDLEGAKSSVLYAALASIGRHFMEIEETAFQMT